MKKFLIIIFGFSLFSPVFVLADSPIRELNFCSALNQIRSESQTVINQKEQVWQANLGRRVKVGLVEKDQAKIKLSADWKKEDERWAGRFDALGKAAKTVEEKNAASSLEVKIKELINIRREKIQVAFNTKQVAKQTLLTNYSTQVAEAIASFKVSLNQEILQTQTDCVSSKADSEAIGIKFKTERQRLSQSLAGTLRKIKNDATNQLTIINQTKDRAVDQAWADFRDGLRAEQEKRSLK